MYENDFVFLFVFQITRDKSTLDYIRNY